MRRKFPKYGWFETARIDPNTGHMRSVRILYKNNREVRYVWMDYMSKAPPMLEREMRAEIDKWNTNIIDLFLSQLALNRKLPNIQKMKEFEKYSLHALMYARKKYTINPE